MKKQLFSILFFLGFSVYGFSQTAGFTMDVSSGCAPLCATFSDQATNALSWSWDFGDASAGSTLQNPTHCFFNGGVYTITLTETFSSGTSTATGTVTVYPNPVAAFTFSNNGNVVTFTDQSTGAATWQWDFGDASGQSTQQNPVYTYASSGNYTVFLLVTSSAGCADSVSHTVTPTGINDYVNSIGWNIYPNPAQGQISIHFDELLQNEKTISVENVLGEIILQEKISGNATIDLSNQSAGIYFVRLNNGPAKKLVVE